MPYDAETIKDLNVLTPVEGASYIPELNDSDREIKRVLKNQYAVRTATSGTTLTAQDYVLICNGTFTVSLPTPSSVAGNGYLKNYCIVNVGTGTITVSGTISGQTNPTIGPGGTLVFFTDGTSWYRQTVDTNAILDNAITTSKIANNAITTIKIANNAITTIKIANNAITTSKIVDNAITTSKIVDNAITTSKIVDATATPTANKIPIADSNGWLATGWVLRRYNGNNFTQDYMLQVGEEAVYDFTNATQVPLKIATQNGMKYQLLLFTDENAGNSGGVNSPIYFYPNNTTYSNAFAYREIICGDNNIFGGNSLTYSAFCIGMAFSFLTLLIQNYTKQKGITGQELKWGTQPHFAVTIHFSCSWLDTTTQWTSLGTVVFPQSTTGQILVRRLA